MFIIMLLTICFSSYLFILPIEGKAATEEPKVLVVYSNTTGEVDEMMRTLDLLIGHFTSDITFVTAQKVKKKDLKNVTHLFYYGNHAERLPASYLRLYDDFTGTFVAIGYNAEQLGDHFNFIHFGDEKIVHSLISNSNEIKINIAPEYVVEMTTNKGKVLMSGEVKETKEQIPIVIQHDNHFYFAIDDFSSPKNIMIGDCLFEVFAQQRSNKNPAYIRLEDIHPLADADALKEITTMLKKKNIPFMMAVIPVYTNPETGKKYHFSDSPKLLKVLKEAQDHGGSVVLHGYTHQFRESETGEGFEFWDVQYNRPIYTEADQSLNIKSRTDFSSAAGYERYMKELQSFESEYIRTKVTRGIQELTNYGLYPLAFEAPHYTMSQNGYAILSEYFSTYVGQVQLTDRDWEIMETTPYISKPVMLNGMELLPETMGYVQPENAESILQMMERAQLYRQTQSGILGAFYHPYLGVDKFQELIEKMEQIPNVEWIDLKKRDIWVKAENVDIRTMQGVIIPKIQKGALLMSSIDFSSYYFNRFIDSVIWMMAIIGAITVFLFIGCTIFLANRNVSWKG